MPRTSTSEAPIDQAQQLHPFSSYDDARSTCDAWLQQAAFDVITCQPSIATAVLAYEAIPVIDERLRTAMTNGEALYFNPWFMATLSQPERAFVYAHELWHILLRHHDRRGSREPHTWNLACDHEVNTLLKEEGMQAPEHAWFGPRRYFSAGIAEIVYNDLQEAAETIHQLARIEQRREEAIEALKKANGKQKKRFRGLSRRTMRDLEVPEDGPTVNQVPAPARSPEDARKASVDASSYTLPLAGQQDPRYPEQLWSVRADAVLERLHDSVVETLRGSIIGSFAGYGAFDVEEGENRTPWIDLLRERLDAALQRTETTWTPSRRHIHRGVYMPGRRRQPSYRLAVAVDTSGSTMTEWPTFVASLKALIASDHVESVRYLECDCEIHRDETFENPAELPSTLTRFRGGGGTSFDPVFERLRTADADALIYFSDGHGRKPERDLPFPVIWMWTGEE